MGFRTGMRYRFLVAVAAMGLMFMTAGAASANTWGPGLAPMPDNPITYQPLKHTCNSRLPIQICQDFTVDIETSLNGGIVSLLYTQNYFCDLTTPSQAKTGCEFGQKAKRLPPGVAGWRYTDPLYLMFPSGALAKEPNMELKPECQHPGLCTDHPSTIDFSRVLGGDTHNMLLPVHDHFETTRNGNRPEWHNLYSFMVSKKSSWDQAENSHNVRTLFELAKERGSGVRGPFPSNIFFFFQTLPGSPVPQEVAWSQMPSPTVNTTTMQDPSIIGTNDSLLDHVFELNSTTLKAFFGPSDIKTFNLTANG